LIQKIDIQLHLSESFFYAQSMTMMCVVNAINIKNTLRMFVIIINL